MDLRGGFGRAEGLSDCHIVRQAGRHGVGGEAPETDIFNGKPSSWKTAGASQRIRRSSTSSTKRSGFKAPSLKACSCRANGAARRVDPAHGGGVKPPNSASSSPAKAILVGSSR